MVATRKLRQRTSKSPTNYLKTSKSNTIETVDYKKDYLLRLKNKKYARELLIVAFEECCMDGQWETFGLLLQDLIEAQGYSIKNFVNKTKVSRQHLYRLFKKDANPSLKTVSSVLSPLGIKLTLTEMNRKVAYTKNC